MESGAWDALRTLDVRGLYQAEPSKLAEFMMIDGCEKEFWPAHQRIPYSEAQLDIMRRGGLEPRLPVPDIDNAVALYEKLKLKAASAASISEEGEVGDDEDDDDEDNVEGDGGDEFGLDDVTVDPTIPSDVVDDGIAQKYKQLAEDLSLTT
jgi:hypothetical protein